jgi:hypothetical protein
VAALAGVGGFVMLTLPGLVGATVDGVNHGFYPGWFFNDWINWSTAVTFYLTPFLIVGSTIAWLWVTQRTEKKAAA